MANLFWYCTKPISLFVSVRVKRIHCLLTNAQLGLYTTSPRKIIRCQADKIHRLAEQRLFNAWTNSTIWRNYTESSMQYRTSNLSQLYSNLLPLQPEAYSSALCLPKCRTYVYMYIWPIIFNKVSKKSFQIVIKMNI